MSRSAPHYLLFAEAGCTDNTPPTPTDGGWRFQLQALDGGVSVEAESEEPHVDHNRLQLLAVVRGLEALDQPSHVTLVTASRYVQRGLRFGLREWRHSDWQWEHFGRRKPIRNADLWQRVDQALRFHQVRCRCWRFAAVVNDPWGAPSEPGIAARLAAARVAQVGRSTSWARLGQRSWEALRRLAQLGSRTFPARAVSGASLPSCG